MIKALLDKIAGAMGYTLVMTDEWENDKALKEDLLDDSIAIGELVEVMDEPETTQGETFRKLAKVKKIVDDAR